jgi:hypothetical protein
VLVPIVIRKLRKAACAWGLAGEPSVTVPTTCESPIRVTGLKNPRLVSARALLVKASITAQATAESIASLFVGIIFIFIRVSVGNKEKASGVPTTYYCDEKNISIQFPSCYDEIAG